MSDDDTPLFRVRDLDSAKGPGKIWGENLDIIAARELKESIAGARMSRSVFIEPMTETDSTPPTSTPVPAAPPVHRPVKFARIERTPKEPAPAAPADPMKAPFLRIAKQNAEAAAAELAARAQRRADREAKKAEARRLAEATSKLPEIPVFDEGDLGETSEIATDIGEGDGDELDDAAITDLLDGTDVPGADNIQ